MDELIKTFPTVLRALGNTHEVSEAAAIVAWKKATGEGLREHTVAKELKGKTLVVEVRDAIWQNQLSLMKSQLLFRINSILGQALVSNIDLKVNPQGFAGIVKTKEEATDILDSDVPIELFSAASAIEDKQLRQKFLRAALGALKRKGK